MRSKFVHISLQDTFEYNSALWTNNVTLNVDVGLNGLSQNEMKTASYHNTPFTKICLGMTRNNVTNWILVNYTARSLYSVIADGNYHATNVGRAHWSSLLEGSLLDQNCGMEGFNLLLPMVNARIGLAANNENNCDSHDSVIGFGITQKSHSKRVSSGNVQFASSLKAFGYILVQ